MKSFHNQCNGNVVRSHNPFNQCNPWSKKMFTVVCLYPCNLFIVNVIRGRDCSSLKLSRITQSGRQTISSTEDATPYMHTHL